MGLRAAACYRRLKRPFTRQSQKKPRKSYVVGVPGSKLVSFEMGNSKQDFPIRLELVSQQDINIRSEALESVRTNTNKILSTGTGPDGYLFKILVYPHHVLRENKMATGAGADRLAQGMARSFGKPVGTAARVRKGQPVLLVRTTKDKIGVANEALRIAYNKLPGKYSIEAIN